MSSPSQQGAGSYRSSQYDEEDDFSYDDDDDYDSVLHGDHGEDDDDDDDDDEDDEDNVDEAVVRRHDSMRSEYQQEDDLVRSMEGVGLSQHSSRRDPTGVSETHRALVMSAAEGGSGGFHTAAALPGPFVVLQGIPGDGMRNTIDNMPSLLADGGENAIGGLREETPQGGESGGTPESSAIDIARSIGGTTLSDASGHTGTVHSISEADTQLQQVRRRREVTGELLGGSASSMSRQEPRRTSSSDDFVAVHRSSSSQAEQISMDGAQDTRQRANHNSARTSSPGGASRALGLAHVLPLSGSSSPLPSSPMAVNATAAESFVVVPTDESRAATDPPTGRRRNRPPSFPHGSTSLRSSSRQQGGPRRFRGVNLTDDERRSIRRWSDECRERELRRLLELGPPTPPPEANQSSTSLSSALSLDHQQHHHLQLLLRQRWWQRNGLLAVFREVPVVLTSSRAVDGEVVGALSPGCTIMATEALTLDSQTLVRLDERAIRERLRSRGGRRGAMIGGSGRGLCQMLRVESPRVGYVVYSLDGYPFLGPGLPSYYTEPNIWTWRVTCHEGAFIRDGLELTSAHVDTVPYGSFLRVTRKTINSMGLSRLRVEAALDGNEDDDHIDDDMGRRPSRRSVLQQATHRAASLNSSAAVGLDILSNRPGVLSGGQVRFTGGWISEELNPLSGQRGPVVQPVPFPVPALYRVTLDEGAVIRSDVELSSSQIGHAPAGTVVTVVGRAYSQHPMDQCIERLRLAGGGGWISVRLNRPPPMDQLVVEMVGIDGSFDPDEPGFFHLDAQRRVLEEFHDRNQSTEPDGMDSVVASLQQLARPTESVRERADGGVTDVATTASRADGSADQPAPNSESRSLDAAPSSVRRSGVAGDSKRGGSKGARHRPNDDEKCLICLTEPRTATIVHGETGHVACCLTCARILKARGDRCPVCRLRIDSVIQQFWA